MSEENIALYTKYRPQKFSEVLGQEQVTDVLTSALRLGNISHAYLFSGSRGTGKTSVARILANEIGTSNNDLYEIDAASNNGVDEIRRLNEAMRTLPFESKYKVYILDEVHMLSTPAFNALLKTLEEPPKHVVFILATTEPQKIPETVVSRCEAYSFKPPNRAILANLAITTAEKEGYKLESSAAELIAILGDSSFRDTHTTLQKLIRSSTDRELSIEEVEKVTGAPQTNLVNNMIESIILRKLEKGMSVISILKEKNIDIKVFLKLLLEKIRTALLLKVAPNEKNLYQNFISEDDIIFLQKLIKENKSNLNLNSKVLLNLLKVYEESLKVPMPYLPLEIFLIDFSLEKG